MSTFEEEVRAKHERFKTYDCIPHLIYLADKHGSISHINEAFVNFSKKAEDDLGDEGGEGWLKNVHPDDVEKTKEVWGKSLATQTPYENVYRLLNAEGQYQWFLTRANLTDLFGGEEFAWVGTCTDISEQMNLQVDLQRQKALLNTIIQKLPVAVIIVGYPDGNFLSANDKMSEIWQKKIPEFTSWRDYDSMVGFRVSEDESNGTRLSAKDWPLTRTLLTKETVQDDDMIEIMRGDGNRGLIKMTSAPVFDPNGQCVVCIAICEDITEKAFLKKNNVDLYVAAQTALESNKLKSAFLANMSHDIRTPMNGILGCTQLLLDTKPTPEQKEYLDIIGDSGRVLLSLINDILDLSKIEAGKIEFEKIPFSTEEMLNGLLEMTKASLKNTGKHVELVLDCADMVAVIGDQPKIERIIGNLLSNAIKFTPDGGKIEISAKCTKFEPTVKVPKFPNGDDKSLEPEEIVEFFCSVRDNGIGIAKEVQSKLFSAFVQADTSTTRKFGGTGLGLSICKDMIALMKGRIWLDSELGHGSTFSLTIPLPRAVEEHATPSELGAPEHQQPIVTRELCRILLVDDAKINAVIARRILVNAGYIDVDIAMDGVQAIEHYLRHKYDLILMDCQMPIMDGFEASRKIRNLGGNLPIIAFTASVMEEERLRCIESGMNDVILKPIKAENLIKIMDKYLFGI